MIPFNKPSITKLEEETVLDCLRTGQLSGDHKYTKLCEEELKNKFGMRAVLTTSGSSSLDISAILCNLTNNDEVILPSYTFVSTANSFALRGAKIVFADVDSKTMNISPDDIENKITNNTKAICAVHYAGVSCNMKKLQEIAQKYNLKLVEDAAQAIGSYYNGIPLGTIGDMGCFSFHETKNIVMGEGGALVVKDDNLFDMAEIIREKGTNRKQFFKGFVDKYTWQTYGSSYLPSDILSALLYAQLVRFDEIQQKRINIWNRYYDELAETEKSGNLIRPYIPDYATNNAHMFYCFLENENVRSKLIDELKKQEIIAPFHYIPLHLSPVGKNLGYKEGDLPVTEEYSRRLIRLPLYADMTEEEQERVIKCLKKTLN